ncbi:MAG: carbon monoxide dehydrogenase subunit G [Rhodospirillales bacterium]|nr:carbon monoxide dehydrogenase subunit G [Rhodospirillales bacterium]
MQMSAQRRLPAGRATVWTALNDLETLRESIPGCEKLAWTGDDRLAAEVTTKVGPIQARFRGTLVLSEQDPPSRLRLTGEGQGGSAGFATGSALISLDPDGEDGEETMLSYVVEATVGGKLAQVGARLIDAAAARLADQFFDRFTAIIAASPSPPQTEDHLRRGLGPALWVPALIVAVLAMVYFFGRS